MPGEESGVRSAASRGPQLNIFEYIFFSLSACRLSCASTRAISLGTWLGLGLGLTLT